MVDASLIVHDGHSVLETLFILQSQGLQSSPHVLTVQTVVFTWCQLFILKSWLMLPNSTSIYKPLILARACCFWNNQYQDHLLSTLHRCCYDYHQDIHHSPQYCSGWACRWWCTPRCCRCSRCSPGTTWDLVRMREWLLPRSSSLNHTSLGEINAWRVWSTSRVSF